MININAHQKQMTWSSSLVITEIQITIANIQNKNYTNLRKNLSQLYRLIKPHMCEVEQQWKLFYTAYESDWSNLDRKK